MCPNLRILTNGAYTLHLVRGGRATPAPQYMHWWPGKGKSIKTLCLTCKLYVLWIFCVSCKLVKDINFARSYCYS